MFIEEQIYERIQNKFNSFVSFFILVFLIKLLKLFQKEGEKKNPHVYVNKSEKIKNKF